MYVGNARTGRTDGSVDFKNNTFGPNVKYAILPNTAKFSSMPFGTCTDLKCVFYGRKYSEIKTSERNRNLAKYAGGTEDADLYYFTETGDDMSVPNALYWRYKPGSLDIVQVMDSSYNVTAEYDFSTEIS